MKKFAYILVVFAMIMIGTSLYLINSNSNNEDTSKDKNVTYKKLNEADMDYFNEMALNSFKRIYPLSFKFKFPVSNELIYQFDELVDDGFKFEYDTKKYKCNFDKSYIMVSYDDEHGVLRSAYLDCYYIKYK